MVAEFFFRGYNYFYCVIIHSVTNLKSCSNGVFKAYIYLYAEQLTPSAPLASQGAITQQGKSVVSVRQLGVINIPI